jgi:hypothetical protein
MAAQAASLETRPNHYRPRDPAARVARSETPRKRGKKRDGDCDKPGGYARATIHFRMVRLKGPRRVRERRFLLENELLDGAIRGLNVHMFQSGL